MAYDGTSQVFSGARALLKINDKTVGYCLAMTGSTVINYAPIDCCGTLGVVEHVPTGYTVEMTAQLSRLASFSRLAEASMTAGEWADSQIVASPAIMPSYGADGLDIINSAAFQATIYDRVSKSILYTIDGVKCSNKSWDVGARAAVAENCTFVAARCQEVGL
jgi:hypothetical protein